LSRKGQSVWTLRSIWPLRLCSAWYRGRRL